jgi:tRNA-2-methylthio-N6-dimethylallyladenosine synthase
VARKYLVETFGCQMNYHDSERIAGLLERDGYEAADGELDADVIVVNTCSVRERAVDKLHSRLGEIREATALRSSRPLIAVTGCVAQQEGDALLKRDRDIDVVAGTQQVKQIPALIAEALRERRRVVDVNPHDDVSFPLGVARPSDPVRAWITIIEGCNEFCSFCVVPYTRGHERMRPSADIVREAEEAVRQGRCEVQLLGQIVNHYQAPDDPSCDFPALLERVSRVEGLRRLRFASPHPRHVSDRLIAAIRDLPVVCKHLHMPVQSGSNRILKAMRRRYSREEYLALVDRLRAAIPDVALSTDMIVGFPGETDADFEDTLDLVRRARFHAMYSFKYSPRPNTLAAKRLADDVTEREKTRRIVALQDLQRDVQGEWHRAMVGRTFDVLADAVSRRRSWELAGRTSGNTVVNFEGPPEWIGRLVPVRVVEAGPNSVRGTAEVAGEARKERHAG